MSESALQQWTEAWRQTLDSFGTVLDHLVRPPDAIPTEGDQVERKAALEAFVAERGGNDFTDEAARKAVRRLTNAAESVRERLEQALTDARIELLAYDGKVRPRMLPQFAAIVCDDDAGNHYCCISLDRLEARHAALQSILEGAVPVEVRPRGWICLGLCRHSGEHETEYRIADALRWSRDLHRRFEDAERRRKQKEADEELERLQRRQARLAEEARQPGVLAGKLAAAQQQIEALQQQFAELKQAQAADRDGRLAGAAP